MSDSAYELQGLGRWPLLFTSFRLTRSLDTSWNSIQRLYSEYYI